MDFNAEKYLAAVTRAVGERQRDGKPVRTVTLTRTCDTTVDDLWNAVTNRDRLPRWFAQVNGDFAPGGRFQIEGNAEGTIEKCESPSLLAVTWEFAGYVSWVEARMSTEDDEQARLTVTHIMPLDPDDEHWNTYGPGAGGVGWELGLLGLALHLSGIDKDSFDENEFAASPAGRIFITGSAERWGKAAIVAGEDVDHAIAAAQRTAAFYLGEEVTQGD